jgi:hypothetical protein
MSEAPKVYKAISSVMAELAKIGISKDQKNRDQGYSFRGIDDVYNAVSSILPKYGLVIIPQYKTKTESFGTTKTGTQWVDVVVHGEFTIACSEDGSTIIASLFGEGRDTADKAMNKAMSSAYKYLFLQLFCIPTEAGSDDGDRDTIEGRSDIGGETERMIKACNTLEELNALANTIGRGNLEPFRPYFNARHTEIKKAVKGA